MADVLRPVELAAERADDVPVISDRTAVGRFPAGQAAEDGKLVRAARAGDPVQDVFLTAWHRLDDLRDPAAFGGWIAMVARNRATDFHRRTTDFVELPDNLESPGAASAPADANAALAAIRSLPDAYRENLIRRLVEGLSGLEIAERTGLTPGSVRVNLHRGMKMLRDKLHR